MQYLLTSGWEEGVANLCERLMQELSSGKKVLWLLSGGSNIKPAVRIMDMISPEASRNLQLLLVDERYGDVGHPDSNCKQLLDAGFDRKQAQANVVLQPGLDFEATRQHYETALTEALVKTDVVIAQLGIGADGHIAGILPKSPAAYEEEQLVAKYHHDPFDRLTATFPALKRINAAYIFAYGDDKRLPLTNLQTKELALDEQPSQILKQLPEAYIYNDQIGDYA